MARTQRVTDLRSPALRFVYLATAGMLALSGFAQMPIFKRYYIADIPGLGWLAAYYTTHMIHYIGAIVLMTLLAYAGVRYLSAHRSGWQVSPSGWLRGALLAAILITGVLRVIKNFEGFYFSSGVIIFLDLLHLAAVVGFLMVGLYCALGRRRWLNRLAQ